MNNNLHKKKTAYCQPAGSFPAPMVQENRLCLMNGKKIALVDGYAVGELRGSDHDNNMINFDLAQKIIDYYCAYRLFRHRKEPYSSSRR